MAKNIVLCSDGTGNKGGSGPDTNVFKIYNAVRINDIPADDRMQIVFYDNGVGTSKLSFLKALGGGLGLGFRHNVRDLYEFLGRNYADGDHVYIFGFSRGAATVRAFAGMLECCGLVHRDPSDKNKRLHLAGDSTPLTNLYLYFSRESAINLAWPRSRPIPRRTNATS